MGLFGNKKTIDKWSDSKVIKETTNPNKSIMQNYRAIQEAEKRGLSNPNRNGEKYKTK